MAKHSEQGLVPTQVSYLLKSSLRFSRFQLNVKEQDESDWKSYAFDDGPVQIGTLPEESDIILQDETVSRRHCQIIRDGDHYILEDLRSTNGTFVQGLRVREFYLAPGVEFKVGHTRLTFNRVSEQIAITPTTKKKLGHIVGGDIKMREIFTIIEKISHTDTTVVIEGDTGTGKDVVARTIHETSRRAGKPFVVFDCSAVPEYLIESELFGHEKGSFTGAIMARQGLFELANGGSIFLDELGELSLDLQPKLLRVLENRKIRRVGGSRATAVDVRVIAATNRNLDEEVKAGRFREDLFYRLSVVRLFLPPLKDRISDVSLLIDHVLVNAIFNLDDNQNQKVIGIETQAMELLLTHTWPGNVRELINVLERACSFVDGQMIRPEDLPPHINQNQVTQHAQTVREHLNRQRLSPPIAVNPAKKDVTNIGSDTLVSSHDEPFEGFKKAKEKWITLFERDYILTALKRSRYNISHAAREAEIDRKYFRKLMHKYGIEVP
jgi:transcriptional regulator with GAF, ATPase, and Fis domain